MAAGPIGVGGEGKEAGSEFSEKDDFVAGVAADASRRIPGRFMAEVFDLDGQKR